MLNPNRFRRIAFNNINIRRNFCKINTNEQKKGIRELLDLIKSNKYYNTIINGCTIFGTSYGLICGCKESYKNIKNINDLGDLSQLCINSTMKLIGLGIYGAMTGFLCGLFFPFILSSFIVGYGFEKFEKYNDNKNGKLE